jgi:hypothetical protein
MNQRSTLGYSSNSPYNMEDSNSIDANGITMGRTTRPLVASNNKGAAVLSPGKKYSKIQGNTTEMPIETLLALEPVLLERHLSTLKDKDKEIFTDKYQVLGTNMKVAALTQMLSKYPDVAQALQGQQSFQNGGNPDPLPLSGLPLYEPASRSTLDYQAKPIQPLNYNAMFLDFALPATNQAQALDKQGRFGEASSLRQDVLTANQSRADLEAQDTTQFQKSYRKGGKVLSKAKAAEILHDGTIHGKPITDKQRRFFAATAYGKNKKMQSGGETKGWKYEAPPTDGFHLVGIESNRPQKGSLPPQGVGKAVASSRAKKPLGKTQDVATPEEEAFWARQRQRYAAEQNTPYYTNPESISPAPAANRFQFGSMGMSNTITAIANVTQDPVYSLVTTSMAQGGARSTPGPLPTPWYALDMSRPSPAMARSTTMQAGIPLESGTSKIKMENNPLMPPREVTNRFVFISFDRSKKWENVLDPITNTRYRRDTATGKYYEGFSSNPDRTEAQQMEMYKLLQK